MAKKAVKKTDPEKGAHLRVLIAAVFLSGVFSFALFFTAYSGIKVIGTISGDLDRKMIESDFRYQCQILYDLYNCDESAVYKLKTPYYSSYFNTYHFINFKDLCEYYVNWPTVNNISECVKICPQCNPDLLKEDPCQSDEDCRGLNPSWYCDLTIGFCRS